MTAFLIADCGTSFATRQRANEIADRLPLEGVLELDFSGVLAVSPSFADELLGRLALQHSTFELTGVAPDLLGVLDRTIERRGLQGRVQLLATV